jgi:hypothetical protein
MSEKRNHTPNLAERLLVRFINRSNGRFNLFLKALLNSKP